MAGEPPAYQPLSRPAETGPMQLPISVALTVGRAGGLTVRIAAMHDQHRSDVEAAMIPKQRPEGAPQSAYARVPRRGASPFRFGDVPRGPKDRLRGRRSPRGARTK